MRALGLGRGDEILSPSYHAGPDIEAMLRVGVSVSFYDSGVDLVPDEAELEGLISAQTRALYLVHYCGFPQDAPRWRRWCDRHGLLLIEDAAQAWLAEIDGRPLGSFGDLAITCPYKMLPLPDGALALCRDAAPAQADGARRLGLGSVAHAHAAWLGQRMGAVGAGLSRMRRRKPFDAVAHVALNDPTESPATVTQVLLRRVDFAATQERRRLNYERLLQVLGEHVPHPFRRLPAGACPWYFPIECDARTQLVEELRAARISAMEVWAEPHPTLPPGAFPAAERWRASTVALPVHQELRARDLDQIAGATRALLRGSHSLQIRKGARHVRRRLRIPEPGIEHAMRDAAGNPARLAPQAQRRAPSAQR
jgi:dTDP-4-amino-4,6-dideoxygalactose transaminase